MGKVTKMSAVCKACGYPLDINHVGPCPKCGKTGKFAKVEIKEPLSFKDSLDLARRREFYKTNKRVRNIIIGITVLSPFIGLLLTEIVGLLFGLAIGALSYFLSPYAVTKVREEIERWKIR
jgi:predicted nucleic-acid-binding Zn-ribbon protein